MKGITYRINPVEADANADRILKVIDAVRASGIDLTYAAAHVDGRGTFVHVAQGAAFAAFEALPEFQEFQSALRQHLVSPPTFFEFDPLGFSGPLEAHSGDGQRPRIASSPGSPTPPAGGRSRPHRPRR